MCLVVPSLITAAMAAVALQAPGSSPCDDPVVRCPDLTMRRPSDLHLLKGRYLASTNAIVNVGLGPAEVKGRKVGRYRMAAHQVLRTSSGPARVLPASGRLVFYDTRTRGKYWKFQDAARFELRTLNADGTVGSLRRVGPKLIYCLRDLRRVTKLDTGRPFPGSPREFRFPACSQDPTEKTRTLGTSVGWADVYPWSYPDNWISVRGLSGCFAYVHRADPQNHFVELDETNNAAATVVRLPFRPRNGRIDAGCPKLTGPLSAPAAAPGTGGDDGGY